MDSPESISINDDESSEISSIGSIASLDRCSTISRFSKNVNVDDLDDISSVHSSVFEIVDDEQNEFTEGDNQQATGQEDISVNIIDETSRKESDDNTNDKGSSEKRSENETSKAENSNKEKLADWKNISTEYLYQFTFDGPSSAESESDIEIMEEVRKERKLKEIELQKKRKQYFKNLKISVPNGIQIKDFSHKIIHLRFSLRKLGKSKLIPDYYFRVILKPNCRNEWHVFYSSVPPEVNIRKKFSIQSIYDNDIQDCIEYLCRKVTRFAYEIRKDRESDRVKKYGKRLSATRSQEMR